MLQLLILLATLQAISADKPASVVTKPAWADTKARCEVFLSDNGISLSDLTEATYDGNYAALVEQTKAVTYELGVNCFSLLTKEQRSLFTTVFVLPDDREMSTGAVDGQSKDRGRPTALPGDHNIMPDEYNHADMMMMTGARQQGSCGSCWAFSALSLLENAYIKHTGEWHEEVDFSEQQLTDCTYTRSGCEGGWMSFAWQRITEYNDGKICSEAQYPYSGTYGSCSVAGKGNAFAKMQLTTDPTSGSNVYRWYSDKVNTTKIDHNNISYTVMADSTAQFIWHNYSVSVAIMAEDAFFNYQSGIFNTHSESDSINHAVTIFGYTQEYFNFQNSWGIMWGENGCGKVTRQSGNMIQMFTYMMYPYVECTFGVNQAGYCKASATDDGCMCLNDGLCRTDGGTSYCECQQGWVGDDCSEKGDCDCRNGGTCVEGDVAFCMDDPIYASSCPSWVNAGYCETTSQYHAWMIIHCAKLCGSCTVSECWTTGKADIYDGEISRTASGKVCQNWQAESPHNHSFTSTAIITAYGLGDHNYCRGAGYDVPWCFTMDSAVRWEECQVPLCAGSCNCTEGWSGEKCHRVRKECADCLNGKCDAENGCQCDEGWEGDNCDREERDCGCKNGGKCNVSGGCDCLDGFTGDKCEDEEEKCNKKCKNGKVCYWKTADKMKCKCPDGYYGKGCGEKADCEMKEGKVCAKKMSKDMDRFQKKCKKPWGVKKCPHSCGYC